MMTGQGMGGVGGRVKGTKVGREGNEGQRVCVMGMRGVSRGMYRLWGEACSPTYRLCGKPV